MIYCGYQGTGKSTYCRAHPDTTVDLDSSIFVKNENWYRYYIILAMSYSKSGKNVFISAHREVINCLIESKIDFELMIPGDPESVWRKRLEYRYATKPTRGNMNAILDFEKNFVSDMAFYKSLNCKKNYIKSTIITDFEDYVK